MTKVFIGGSRHVSRLNEQVRKRLDNIMEQGFPVIIGDANGADKAVQTYLHGKGYSAVQVFCTEGICRNNVGHWPIRSIKAETHDRSAQFYSAKDRVMAQEATVGLMMWDGKSVGTLVNVFRLLALSKNVVIYVVPEKGFRELRSNTEWKAFINSCDSALRHKVEQRATLDAPGRHVPLQTSFLG